MRKQQVEHAAHEVATQIRAVEDIIDDALGEIAELQARMVRARATTGVGIATGHAAFEQLATALQGLVTARGGMAAKLQAALSALDGGVQRVRISDIAAITDPNRGTVLTRVGSMAV